MKDALGYPGGVRVLGAVGAACRVPVGQPPRMRKDVDSRADPQGATPGRKILRGRRRPGRRLRAGETAGFILAYSL